MMRVAQCKTRLIFETDDFIFERGQNRQIVIDARPSYCLMRLKGQRRQLAVAYAAMYNAAARFIADAERRQKARRLIADAERRQKAERRATKGGRK